jgi:hypothetical protein
MLLALVNGQRMRAEQAGSGARGTCPFTGHSVKACVGHILQYWAYVGGAPNFERGYEPESEWHLWWKRAVEDEFCEVIFGPNGEHRADIVGGDNSVIEIQHSRIDIRDVQDRVAFYRETTGRRVVWVVDIQRFWRKTFKLGTLVGQRYKVEWKPKQDWVYYLAQTPDARLFLEYRDTDDRMLQAWVHQGQMWAQFENKLTFFESYLLEIAKPEFRAEPRRFLPSWAG